MRSSGAEVGSQLCISCVRTGNPSYVLLNGDDMKCNETNIACIYRAINDKIHIL